MAPLFSIFGSDKYIDNWIKEADLVNYNMKEYQSPIRMRVSKESDSKDVVRRMDKYKPLDNKRGDLYVLIPGHKKEKRPGLFGGGVTEHKGARTTKTPQELGKNLNMPINLNFGEQIINISVEDGEPDTYQGSRSRGDGSKEKHRPHRHRRSNDSQDNRYTSPNRQRDGHGRDRRRDQSRDTLPGKENENSRSENRRKRPELDSREKTHGRTKHREDNSESEDSGTEISRPSRRAPTVNKEITEEDLPEIDAISLASSQKPPIEKAFSVKSSIQGHRSRNSSERGIPLDDFPKTKTSSLVSSHGTSTGRKSSTKDSKQDTPLKHIPEIDARSITPSQNPHTAKMSSIKGPVSEHESRDSSERGTLLEDFPGTVASSRKTFTGSSHSLRAPSTTAQSRTSKKNDTLPPSLYNLTKKNKDLLDEEASQDGRNSTSSQHSKPKSQEVFQENRDRRRLERKNGLSHTV
ncbi:putative dynamin family protein [Botrytis fragariae]|uniref:Putative dynamin family protein n=1 Tax=Botrytis fragariae TaxID=1964551 RepID=A0A8H6EM70_9HELO|nr:putative dynamin family protein [Botrytis fragariae]KAF5877426.1 putative dynamin family protein [Botrytis fragariae]